MKDITINMNNIVKLLIKDSASRELGWSIIKDGNLSVNNIDSIISDLKKYIKSLREQLKDAVKKEVLNYTNNKGKLFRKSREFETIRYKLIEFLFKKSCKEQFNINIDTSCTLHENLIELLRYRIGVVTGHLTLSIYTSRYRDKLLKTLQESFNESFINFCKSFFNKYKPYL